MFFLENLAKKTFFQSLEGAEQAARFATPNLAVAREKAKKKSEADKVTFMFFVYLLFINFIIH